MRIVIPGGKRGHERVSAYRFATLYKHALLNGPCALPPVLEQRRIVAHIDDLVSVEEKTAELAYRGLVRIPRLRQSILKWAFEGKLVDQGPNDEPASALLERIRAEREAAAPAKKSPPSRCPGPLGARMPTWPPWWDWELELTPHVERRMEDGGFTEVDLRRIGGSW